jgi:hypothetical protein
MMLLWQKDAIASWLIFRCCGGALNFAYRGMQPVGVLIMSHSLSTTPLDPFGHLLGALQKSSDQRTD